MLALYEDMTGLSDEDAVRICAILMVEVVFLGHQAHTYVSDVVLMDVYDMDIWNEYPWGSHIWTITYKHMDGAINRRTDISSKISIYGFLYAFQVI